MGQRRVSTPRPGPFVGRRAELDALQAALDEASTERLSRFVLVVGEPGIGKTRLLNEFGARVTSVAGADDAARGVRWFRGDCRPFGGGVTFSALEDVVRAHAGIGGDEDAVAREARLAAAVPEGPDAAWIRARLRPLVGLPGETAGREEDFAAWRAHLVHHGGRRPPRAGHRGPALGRRAHAGLPRHAGDRAAARAHPVPRQRAAGAAHARRYGSRPRWWPAAPARATADRAGDTGAAGGPAWRRTAGRPGCRPAPGRRRPAVCGGVRAPAGRPWLDRAQPHGPGRGRHARAAPAHAAGRVHGPAGHPAAGAEGAAAGCRRAGRRLLARRPGGALGVRRQGPRPDAEPAGGAAAHPPPGTGRGGHRGPAGVRLLPRARARRGLRRAADAGTGAQASCRSGVAGARHGRQGGGSRGDRWPIIT